MNFGQFIDHDLAETPVHDCGDENRTVIQCCQETKCPTCDCKQFLFWYLIWIQIIQDLFFAAECNIAEFACFPFDVPPNDPQLNFGTCRNFQRSLLSAKDLDCQIGAREVGR